MHKTLGLRVPLFFDSTSNIKLQSKEAAALRKVDIFIWDEAPMAPRYALEIMDRLLRDIMSNNLAFGGKVVVLGGDFRQLLPVNINSTKDEVINLSIKKSKCWDHFKTHFLTQNMRTLPSEKEFTEYLIKIGNDILNDNDDNIIITNEQCIVKDDLGIAKAIYYDLLKNKEYEEAAKCAILSSRNIDVDEINQQVIDMLDEDTEKIFNGIDTAGNCNDNDTITESLLPEYLNTLLPLSLPPYELRLRTNTVIMLIRNLSISEGLCNSTRLLVLEMTDHVLKCEVLSGDQKGGIIFLNRISLFSETDYAFEFKRR